MPVCERAFYAFFHACIDKNPTDTDGWTPLHYAAMYGHFNICQEIVNNVQDKNPKAWNAPITPLWLAEETHRGDELQALFVSKV